MKSPVLCLVLPLILGVWGLSIAPAHADTVLYDSSSFVTGQQSFVQSFNITTPGTLTVTLADIPWLDTISNLTGLVTTSSGIVGQTFTDGSESFSVAAGTIYTHWFGDAQGTYNIGVLGVKITFQPDVTPVPLPVPFVLLLSGLGIMLGWQRRPALNGTPSRVATTAH